MIYIEEQFKELLHQCLDGKEYALEEFQNTFGEDIYNFPMKVHRLEKEMAAEFYCYCFDKGRIFKRLKTFEGRCNLRTYQYLVLRDLFTEWFRTLDFTKNFTASLNDPIDHDDETEKGVFVKSDESSPEETLLTIQSMEKFETTLGKIPQNERIYLKLLLFAEMDFEPEDIRTIAKISKRSFRDVLYSLAQLEQSLIQKSEKYALNEENLYKVSSKIFFHQNEISGITESSNRENKEMIQRIEGKIKKRLLQRKRYISKKLGGQATVSYRDIAGILGVSLGTIAANLNKAKDLFLKMYQEAENEK
ncbi:MAG: hypothetical protein FJ242_00010 [Nitrospira sp.]|nr:hypothetical protein [Nitrospira sp.]